MVLVRFEHGQLVFARPVDELHVGCSDARLLSSAWLFIDRLAYDSCRTPDQHNEWKENE